MKFGRTLAAWVVLGLAGSGHASAEMLDPSIVESVYYETDMLEVTALAWAPDGSKRLFVADRRGAVGILDKGAPIPDPFVVLDPYLSPATAATGILGMAFDPDYVNNRYVYFFVTMNQTEQQILRCTDQQNVGIDRSVVVSGIPTRGVMHDGGAIGFGADGKLYFAVGDLGNKTGVGADLSSMAAKVLRVNSDGSVPNDNPFFDGSGPNEDRVWARGFRNPFTLAWRPSNEALWLSVVGSSFETIFEVGAGDSAGWDDYENNQAPGFLEPVVAYRTNGTVARDIAADGAVRSGGVATFRVTFSQYFRPGTKVNITGVADPSFNGSAFVLERPSVFEFRVAQAGPDATSGGGQAATEEIGGCITGGTFWDSSQVPEDYRRSYFFGDYNTGNTERVTLGADGQVLSVDHWATGLEQAIDMAVGPDGALYYAGYAGRVMRAAYTWTTRQLVVTPLHRRMSEGGATALTVLLSAPPANPIDVSVAAGGDVSVAQGSTLSFDVLNWSTPKTVLLEAAEDEDSIDDEVMVTVTSSGLTPQEVRIRVTDDDKTSLILSNVAVTIGEGESDTVEVSLSEPPTADVTVLATLSAEADAHVGLSASESLTFSPSTWSEPQALVIEALQDSDNVDNDATLILTASGYGEREVAVTAVDDDDRAPAFTTEPATNGVFGAPYRYAARADGNPAPSYLLLDAPAGMSVDGSGGVVSWTPDATGDFSVTLAASNGVVPDATQSFTVTVVEDAGPVCQITLPQSGDVLTGNTTEFFGDVIDDVGATYAEFAIDGVIVYIDTNRDGHYHFGGGHNVFDPTGIPDGPHVLSMIGYDTRGQRCAAAAFVTIDRSGGASPDAGRTGEIHVDRDAGEGGVGEPSSTPLDAAPASPDASPDGIPGVEPRGGCSCGHARPRPLFPLPWLLALVAAGLARRSGDPSARRTRVSR